MSRKALFEGLVFDESSRPVGVAYVGGEPCYVIDDAGFKRHVSAEQVDRQVLDFMAEGIKGNEEFIAEQTAKMLGQEDIFTRGLILNQLKNFHQQLEQLYEVGIPLENREYLGMSGFRITVNFHGDVVDVNQPGMIAPEDE
ncbi:MAG TPA: hypothetical protein PKW33_19460 [Anaerolineaceae bacterium]|nr:hypothetical protein [Anaerolineaceae bacterium]HPN53782.1 hypothetical protein [Anaerolineaceae bacterium]